MKRRTLDLLTSAGALGVAALLLVLALVMTSNANFARTYVHDQMAQQHITFKTADTLTAEEAKSACLVKFAGQPLLTGKQAECYANDFIGLHTQTVANGATYADLGDPQTALRTQIAATPATSPALADLQKQLATVTSQRETLFKGETLRGLLLTSFGFSVFGVKGGQAATVSYLASAFLALVAAAGFLHAFKTSKEEGFAPPAQTPLEQTPTGSDGRPLVGV